MDGRLFGQVRSNTPKQHENQKNNQDDTDKTNPAMSITVTVTAEAATETAKQKNDEDDDEIVPTTWRNSFALRQPKARCRGKSVSLLLTSRYVDRIAGSALGARQDPQSVFNLRLIVQNRSQPTSVVGPVSAVNGWAEHVGSARYFRRQLVQLWPHHRSQRLNENFSPRHGPAMVAIIKFGASWLTDKEQ